MMISLSGESSDASSEASTGGGREFEIARVLASLGNNNDIDHAEAAAAAEEEEEVVVKESSGGRGGGRGECMEGQGFGGNNRWGSKGKRWNNSNSNNNNKRVKEVSSLSQLHSSSHSPLPFDLNLDQATVFQDEFCVDNDVKVEEVYESAEVGPVRNQPYNGGRSRHNLTEAEKEARRVRRILANRESARQTIRRRQAYYEELTRKAAELASENESLKRSKELAVKEFQSLHVTNKNLKGKLSQTLGFRLGESKEQAESSCTETQYLGNCSQYMYNTLSANSFVFPACMPPSDLNVVCQSSQQLYNPNMLTEQENASNISGQNMPWCILPCPVLLPVSSIKNGNHQLPSFLLKDKDEGSSVDSKHAHSPCSVIRCLHNCSVVMPEDKRSPLSCCSRGRFSLEREDCITPHSQLKPDFDTTPEKKKERTLENKESSTVAGAEARRKRKELMKLKGRLHCHLFGRENG
ncbi:hypothetical protein BVRB_7g159880 [Beta vulgaris subsp. vulgaris]|nr:hypothetical protein BVRB_7g159880 [Beta vulgaris subsp. vulgaris]